MFRILALACLVALSSSCSTTPSPQWHALFDGKTLQGWTPKFNGHELGVNFNDTFRVEDGFLTVGYDQYSGFDGEYGHLFYDVPYSRYRIRAEYRFLAPQLTLKKGYGWAYRNNGLMLHSQDPKTMAVDQPFPASIEVQLLGADATGERTTGNLCTPNSHVEMNGTLVTDHCITSSSPTFRLDEWVTIEVEVNGSEGMRHFVNGELVLEYQNTQLDDESFAEYQHFYGGRAMGQGYIAIQAESHPTQFRRIEILPLD